MTLPKPVTVADRPQQAEFDWLFPHMRQVLTVAETARAMAVGEQQVRDLVDAGRLEAFGIGDAPERKQERKHLRIWRPSVVRYIAERLPTGK